MVEEGHRSLAGLVLGGCGICRHRRKRQTVYRVALETAKPVPTATAAPTTTGRLKNDGEPALAYAVGSQVEQCYAAETCWSGAAPIRAVNGSGVPSATGSSAGGGPFRLRAFPQGSSLTGATPSRRPWKQGWKRESLSSRTRRRNRGVAPGNDPAASCGRGVGTAAATRRDGYRRTAIRCKDILGVSPKEDDWKRSGRETGKAGCRGFPVLERIPVRPGRPGKDGRGQRGESRSWCSPSSGRKMIGPAVSGREGLDRELAEQAQVHAVGRQVEQC